MSDLGLVPMNDGNLIRMAITPNSRNNAKDLVKVVNKAEEAKWLSKHHDETYFWKRRKKPSDISKDVIKDMEDKIQKLTDQKIKDLEAVTDKKVKEILSVWWKDYLCRYAVWWKPGKADFEDPSWHISETRGHRYDLHKVRKYLVRCGKEAVIMPQMKYSDEVEAVQGIDE